MMKSLRSTGTETARRTRIRSSRVPLNRRPSVSTEIAAAPPASYSAARAAGSSMLARAPLLGLERLTSAITATPGPVNRGIGSIAGSIWAARCFSRSRLTSAWRMARSSRTPAMMSSRTPPTVLPAGSVGAEAELAHHQGHDQRGHQQHGADDHDDPVRVGRDHETYAAHDEGEQGDQRSGPGGGRTSVMDVLDRRACVGTLLARTGLARTGLARTGLARTVLAGGRSCPRRGCRCHGVLRLAPLKRPEWPQDGSRRVVDPP